MYHKLKGWSSGWYIFLRNMTALLHCTKEIGDVNTWQTFENFRTASHTLVPQDPQFLLSVKILVQTEEQQFGVATAHYVMDRLRLVGMQDCFVFESATSYRFTAHSTIEGIGGCIRACPSAAIRISKRTLQTSARLFKNSRSEGCVQYYCKFHNSSKMYSSLCKGLNSRLVESQNTI